MSHFQLRENSILLSKCHSSTLTEVLCREEVTIKVQKLPADSVVIILNSDFSILNSSPSHILFMMEELFSNSVLINIKQHLFSDNIFGLKNEVISYFNNLTTHTEDIQEEFFADVNFWWDMESIEGMQKLDFSFEVKASTICLSFGELTVTSNDSDVTWRSDSHF